MGTHILALLISLSLIANGYCSELMGGHYDNINITSSDSNSQKELDSNQAKPNETSRSHPADEEKIPDPSALIIPGYNLPEHLFNNGKPFYVEKDPQTGVIDFNSKTPADGKDYMSSEYDYVDEPPNPDIFDKANIDRKDGGFGSHRPNDVNQLSPNFHDFLNLPVKYNSEKYVYPLISSSYANTKIQGNVNNYNHKQYAATTYKPTVSPNYYTTRSSVYNKPTTTEVVYTRPTTTSTSTTTTTSKPTETPTTPMQEKYTKSDNLLNSAMNHPSYLTTVENDYDYDYYTTKDSFDNQGMYLTTEPPKKNTFVTSKPMISTTKKPYSIFDELFGDYEEPEPVDKPVKPPALFTNLPTSQSPENKYYNNYNSGPSSQYNKPTTPSTAAYSKQPDNKYHYSNSETVSQVYPETEENNMYEYEDDYNNNYNDEQEYAKNLTTESVTNKNKYEYSTEKSISFSVRNETTTKNVTTEKPVVNVTQTYSNFHQNFNNKPSSSPVSVTQPQPMPVIKYDTIPKDNVKPETIHFTTDKQDNNFISITSENYDQFNNNHVSFQTTKSPEKFTQTSTETSQLTKVTSMPLGENHPPNNPRPPIISLTQNLKESLNREKVETTTIKSFANPTPFEQKNNFNGLKQTVLHPIPSTSNIHIAPDQDIVSFVVGNHQNVEGGHYIGSALKEEPYISNSFRPLYTQQNSVPLFDQTVYNRPVVKEPVGFSSQPVQKQNITRYHEASATINVQPIIGAQASLSIGTPADEIKTVPGQVVDAELDLHTNIEYPKEPGSKIVFPEEDYTTYTPPKPLPNREILSLFSKPMLHQLPADLTPPSEPEVKPLRAGSPRPPWDPRPGHFYQGRPEYARPPRPHKPEVYKRIDGLPNILPQFRPNAKVSNGHYMDSVGTINAGYMPRQPLLDRPSNRPIGFFEKLHPPPPPKRIHDLRKATVLEPDMKHDRYRYEERILSVPSLKQQPDHYGSYQMPPKIPVANRKTEDESEIATLQMIQAKQSDKLDTIKPNVPPPFKINYHEPTEKPLYVVYPVNSAPLKLDVIDTDNRETVVVGTRGEQLPLPPSKINQETPTYDQKPLLKPKDRNDGPILKPHSRPNSFPIKSDFPYTIERPDPTLASNPVGSTIADLISTPNNFDTTPTVTYNKNDFGGSNYQSNNQWTSLDVESRIVNGNKINYVNDQISATLKTYTEKPIAIAYTPTEPTNEFKIELDKYSRPSFGRPVMSEIRPETNKGGIHQYGTVSNDDSEFTVSAVMHTHPQIKLNNQNEVKYYSSEQKTVQPVTSTRRTTENIDNHRLNLDVDTTHVPAKLDFQAPFHASVSVDSEYQGWSVLNNNNNAKSEIDRSDNDAPSTNPPQTSSDFDIENFKPQLFGGFKPIYNSGVEKERSPTTAESERQE